MSSTVNVALLSIFFLENWITAIYGKQGKMKVLQGLVHADFQGSDHFSFI